MDHLASPDPKRSNRNPRNQTPGDQSRAALESLEHCPGRTRVRRGIGDRLPDCIDGILRRVARIVSTHENIQAVNRARHPFDIEDVQISPLDALLRRSAGGSLPCVKAATSCSPRWASASTRLPMFPLAPMIPIFIAALSLLSLSLHGGLSSTGMTTTANGVLASSVTCGSRAPN